MTTERFSPSLFKRENTLRTQEEAFKQAELLMEELGVTKAMEEGANILARNDRTVTIELGLPRRSTEDTKMLLRWGLKGLVHTLSPLGVKREINLASHGICIYANDTEITKVKVSFENDWKDLASLEESVPKNLSDIVSVGIKIGNADKNIVRDSRKYTRTGDLEGISVSGITAKKIFPRLKAA